MDKEKYNDEIIEAMLKDSSVEAPEEITTEVVKALPSIRRKSTLYNYGFRARRKMIMAAFIYLILVTILMLLFTISTMRILRKTLLSEPGSNPLESVDGEQPDEPLPDVEDLLESISEKL